MKKEVTQKLTSSRNSHDIPSNNTSFPNKKTKSKSRKAEGTPKETLGKIIFSGYIKGPTICGKEICGTSHQNGVF